jgi:hypothetical protein
MEEIVGIGHFTGRSKEILSPVSIIYLWPQTHQLTPMSIFTAPIILEGQGVRLEPMSRKSIRYQVSSTRIRN